MYAIRSYYAQESVLESDLTLWEECLQVFADLRQIERELAALEAAMAEASQADEALARYGPLQAEFEHRGGYTYPTLIRQVLGGLGFDDDDYDLPLMHLSGGQRTRAVLALAIGVNTSLYSVARAVRFGPMPYPHAERIVVVNETYPAAGLVEVAQLVAEKQPAAAVFHQQDEHQHEDHRDSSNG